MSHHEEGGVDITSMDRVIRIGTVGSTMDEARRRAREGAGDGMVFFADAMTAGRGQHGHVWHGPEGGIYLSMVLRDAHDPHLLTLALGNAVADVLEVAGADPRLKWVNDVLVDDRKIAGILVEMESTGDQLDFVVIGVGLNLNGTTDGWPDGLDATAVTLESVLGVESCVEDTEDYLIERIDHWIEAVRAGRSDDILAAWRAKDALRGRTVTIEGHTGIAEGIDDEGHLLVDGRSFATGSVSLRA